MLREKRKVLDKYCVNSKCIIIDSYGIFYNTSRDADLSYFDVTFYGNLVYDGTNMMIKKIDSLKNNYFVIGTSCLNESKYNQYNKE